jgi:hypothetical protein
MVLLAFIILLWLVLGIALLICGARNAPEEKEE